ncbi:MAG: TAT-variant-translocated molybdopterin oxidoreductase [Armatimonadetes bacterium]|nr:TAT-variant-translocated molybdopterin oxidoreductase [Armatimonadota bacterium]
MPGFVPLSSIRPTPPRQRLDIAALREKLQNSTGKEYWRSLEEIAETDEFNALMEREFPTAPRDMQPLPRREFLKLMGASLALAGVGGCAYQPAESIVPYVEQPELLIPGKPLFFATSFVKSGYAVGVLAESHMGRPIKVEGNPEHPASLGATDAYTQASILQLYDPDRSKNIRNLGEPTNWDVFTGAMTAQMEELRRRGGGAGLRILTETVTSPTMASQIRALLARYPGARWHQFEPVSRDNIRAGARLAFGADVHPVYHFERADRIVSLDCNFLLEEPGSIRYARNFAERRMVPDERVDVHAPQGDDAIAGGRDAEAGDLAATAAGARAGMNRLYVVESTPTITGAMADHRLPLLARHIEPFARALAAALTVPGAAPAPPPPGIPADWLAALARDLMATRGASLIVAGDHQPPVVHALAHAMNSVLGNVGTTVTYTAPVEVSPVDPVASLRDLVNDMRAGQVEMLVILDANPVLTAPADLNFLDAMKEVPLRIHMDLFDDETGIQCQWHIPKSHYLEAWSDARAYDGTVSIVQPLIKNLYESRSPHELLALLLGQGDRSSYDIVRSFWETQRPAAGFERWWKTVVHDGMIPNTAAAPATAALRADFLATAPPSPTQSGMEIIFRRDPSIWDGRFANNAWLQELPKPLTTLTWDNAALISPATAQSFNLSNEDRVELNLRGRKVVAPVWVMPGHPDGSVSVYVGYGRPNAGKIGTGTGFNAYGLRTTDAMSFGSGLEIRKVPGRYKLATTQIHFSMEGRDIVRVGTLQEYQANPKSPAFAQGPHQNANLPNMYPPEWPSDRLEYGPNVPGHSPSDDKDLYVYPDVKGYNGQPMPQWGMVIDNNVCIGCNACVVGCVAENNIPTVGKDQVIMSREMHWLKVDTYYAGNLDNPGTMFMPRPCMHCEKAPCEPVCPVEATSHSAEGINEMTYNRCVGTRYCSNNCPYKVRRFNYFQYSDQKTPTIQMMQNPDVTVRSRGVMEKCTYCIQRVNEARIEAEKEDRPIRDGDVLTACQQACPTHAIVFGNIRDTASNGGLGSDVSRLKRSSLNYGLLTELNTFPRTTYMAKLRNPNPELAKYSVFGPETVGAGAAGHGAPGEGPAGGPVGEGPEGH